MSCRILIAGIGNIFLGDDAFGVEVIRRLAGVSLPAGVEVRDFGIRGFDLVQALLAEYSTVILVDALSRGGPAGKLYVFEPEPDVSPPGEGGANFLASHSLDP